MANLPDENLSAKNDGIPKLIEYSDHIEDRKMRGFLEKIMGTDTLSLSIGVIALKTDSCGDFLRR